LIKSSRLPGLRENYKQPFNFFSGARPPRASAGVIVILTFGVAGEDLPRAGILSRLIKGYLMQLFGKRRPNRKAAKALYATFPLFEIQGAGA
jgi:hypothetical protein